MAEAPARCGAKFYLVQHYESLYHGDGARVDETYRLPLRKIVISTWLADIMAERFASPAEVHCDAGRSRALPSRARGA